MSEQEGPMDTPLRRLIDGHVPTEEGKRRHPPAGHYFETDEPCTCQPTCAPDCKGECGCAACWDMYQDFGYE